MVGRRLAAHFPPYRIVPRDARIRLDVREMRREPAVKGVSFSVRAGEIVGLAGLIGAGRTEILRAIAGADAQNAGGVLVDGNRRPTVRIGAAISAGIAFITETARRKDLVLGMTVRENVTLAHLASFVDRDLLVDVRASAATTPVIDDLQIRTPDRTTCAQPVGGNATESRAREMAARGRGSLSLRRTARGIDVGAKAEIYKLMLN